MKKDKKLFFSIFCRKISKRRKLETEEVCGFIHQWVEANLEDDEDKMFIALRDGEKVVELKLIRNKDKTE